MVRIDMSEYAERHTVARLIGAPPGYVGYEEGGQLTERVRRRPYTVLLLDELEKAHPDVHNVLLQLFDEGRLTDGKGRVVDFTNTIIIATSNLGTEIIQRSLASGTDYDAIRDQVMDVLRGHLRPELINRLDEVVVFRPLGREQIRDIVGLQLRRVASAAAGQGVVLEFDNTLIDHLADVGYDPEFGARVLKRRIRAEVETKLADALLRGDVKAGDHVRIVYDQAKRDVAFEKDGGKPVKRSARQKAATEEADAVTSSQHA
jgi:ATP-dependent Clp protease ATP-binding subunit ClpC